LYLAASCVLALPPFFNTPRDAHHRSLPSFPTRRSSDLPQDLASFRQLQMWEMIQYIEKLLPAQSASMRERERLRRLRGLLLYDIDRKSIRLNSSHVKISYAVFCLKKKKQKNKEKTGRTT